MTKELLTLESLKYDLRRILSAKEVDGIYSKLLPKPTNLLIACGKHCFSRVMDILINTPSYPEVRYEQVLMILGEKDIKIYTLTRDDETYLIVYDQSFNGDCSAECTIINTSKTK